MKKKLLACLCAIMLIGAGMGAWFWGYFHRKNPDNIPTKETVYLALSAGDGDMEEKMAGYSRNALINVWGEPDGELFGCFGEIWEVEGLGNLIVYYDDQAVVQTMKAFPPESEK